MYIGQPFTLFLLHNKSYKNSINYLGIDWDEIKGNDPSESGYLQSLSLTTSLSEKIQYKMYKKAKKILEKKHKWAQMYYKKKTSNYSEFHIEGEDLHIVLCYSRLERDNTSAIALLVELSCSYHIHYTKFEDMTIKNAVNEQVKCYVSNLQKNALLPKSENIEKHKTIRVIIIVIGIIISILIYAYSNRYTTYKGRVIDKWNKTYIPIKPL